jgi:hypothetical protein
MMTLPASAARAAIAVAALGCAAVLVTACGAVGSNGGAPSSGAGPSPSNSPSASPSPAAASQTTPPQAAPAQPGGPPGCATSALRATVLVSQGGAALGSTYYPIQFSNISAATCNFYGYPGVSFVSAPGGSQIGIAATENPAHPRQFIDVAPGQAAHAVLQVVVAQNFSPADCGTIVTAHWLRIYPPNQTVPLYVGFTAQTCSSGKPTLSVETVQAGATGQ